MTSKLKQCLEIASRELRACYRKYGIIGGTHHFTDYWGRDGYFAALGSLIIGDKLIVEKTLANFYKYQRTDGLIPYRIMRGPVNLNKYLGRPSFYTNPRPTYKLRGIGSEVLDGTTLTVLFTTLLGLTKYKHKIRMALAYLQTREKDGLLHDGVMSEWNDSALKWGNLLYTNVIYWYMFDRLSNWVNTFDRNWSKELESKKQNIAQKLRYRLWTGAYFADWYDYKRQDYFYPYGNCLAIAWGLTTKRESESILLWCKKAKIAFTLETNTPKYPWWRIDILQHIVGMGDYQNRSLLWWLPAASYLAALKKMHKLSDSKEFSKLIINKVLADKAIYECYYRNGYPFKRLFYSSEHPFAWGSGILIWALSFKA